MSAKSLVALLDLIEDAGIVLWLDGDWGVDALLGEQTRPHMDLGRIPQIADVPRMREVLVARGFSLKEGKPPDSFVLQDGDGLKIDDHAVALDADGNDVHRMEHGEDWIVPAESFKGRGRVAGRPVRCLSPTPQVLCHAQGYDPAEKDLADMERLHDRFGVELPLHLQR